MAVSWVMLAYMSHACIHMQGYSTNVHMVR